VLELSIRGQGGKDGLTELRRELEARTEELSPRLEASPPEREGAPAKLSITLHPFAEPIEATRRPDGTIDVVARTFSAGPGYHQYVAELFGEIGTALGIGWKPRVDPGRYFERRERAALLAVLEPSLASTAAQILELSQQGATGFSLLLPDGIELAHDGLVATPLGPRDRAWVERVAKEPSVAADAFPWWEPGLGAGYHRGLAIALLETEVRFRRPLDDRERALLDRVVTSIERAHGLDPSLSLPWAEASELYELLGEDSLRATRASVLAERAKKDRARRPLGYRRRPVRVSLSGGWSLVVPGSLAERWEEHGTWVGWDATRTIWMSSMTAETDAETDATLAGLPEIPGDGDLLVMERGPIRGHARFGVTEEDGKRTTVLRAHAAVGPNVALGTLVLASDDDREWALETWGSLER
jgi:hypothetical protein